MKDDILAGGYVLDSVIFAEYLAKIKNVTPKSLYLGKYEAEAMEAYFRKNLTCELKIEYMPKGKLTMVLGLTVYYVDSPSHLEVA